MSVHYKFKSAIAFDTITFDGLHISVKDLKKAIFEQKKVGKAADFDLQVTNAQTKTVYVDENQLIPKNTSLIIARVPLTVQQKKQLDRENQLHNSKLNHKDSNDQREQRGIENVDLSRLEMSEEDKIKAMMSQSTSEYDPSNYVKIKGGNQIGPVPPNYVCFRCHNKGHWIKDCPALIPIDDSNIGVIDAIRKSTGIPRSFMIPVDGPQVPGARMTPTGAYAVPAIDHEVYKEKKIERPPFVDENVNLPEKQTIPEDLICGICKDLLQDAVMVPCCGMSFCDECIRTALLESDDAECPDCNEKDVSPDTLIPNRFLRTSVNNFKNKTGYIKRPHQQQMTTTITTTTQKKDDSPPRPSLPDFVPPPEYSDNEHGKQNKSQSTSPNAVSPHQKPQRSPYEASPYEASPYYQSPADSSYHPHIPSLRPPYFPQPPLRHPHMAYPPPQVGAGAGVPYNRYYRPPHQYDVRPPPLMEVSGNMRHSSRRHQDRRDRSRERKRRSRSGERRRSREKESKRRERTRSKSSDSSRSTRSSRKRSRDRERSAETSTRTRSESNKENVKNKEKSGEEETKSSEKKTRSSSTSSSGSDEEPPPPGGSDRVVDERRRRTRSRSRSRQERVPYNVPPLFTGQNPVTLPPPDTRAYPGTVPNLVHPPVTATAAAATTADTADYYHRTEDRSGTPTVDERLEVAVRPVYDQYNRPIYPTMEYPPPEGMYGLPPPHPMGYDINYMAPRYRGPMPRQPMMRGAPMYRHGPRYAMRQPPPPGLKSTDDEDPYQAFQRMLKEKEERDKKKKSRKSGSRSRSRSGSRSPVRSRSRSRSRSVRRSKRSRSRSRSFVISRSRSKSYSRSPLSPPRRYYSPHRSPPPRYDRYGGGGGGHHSNYQPHDEYNSWSNRRYGGGYRGRGGRGGGRYHSGRTSPQLRGTNYDNYNTRYRDVGSPSRQYGSPGRQYEHHGSPHRWNEYGRNSRDREYDKERASSRKRSASVSPERNYREDSYRNKSHDRRESRSRDRSSDRRKDWNKDREESGRVRERRGSYDRMRENVRKKPSRERERSRDHDRDKKKRYSRSPKRRSSSREPRKRSASRGKEDSSSSRQRKTKRSLTPKRESTSRSRDSKQEPSVDPRQASSQQERVKESPKIPSPNTVDKDEDDKKKKKDKDKKKKKKEKEKETEEERAARKKRKKERKEEKKRKLEQKIMQEKMAAESAVQTQAQEMQNKSEERLDISSSTVEEKLQQQPMEHSAAAVEEPPQTTAEILEPGEIIDEESQASTHPGSDRAEDQVEEDCDELEIDTSYELLQDVDKKGILAAVPELSKWEMEEGGGSQQLQHEHKTDISLGSPEHSKVTSEVLKRAENAIFKRAINAIRIEPGGRQNGNEVEEKKERKVIALSKDRRTDRHKIEDEDSNIRVFVRGREPQTRVATLSEVIKPKAEVKFHITIPISDKSDRTVEMKSDKKKIDRPIQSIIEEPNRIPVKNRLGSIVEKITPPPNSLIVKQSKDYHYHRSDVKRVRQQHDDEPARSVVDSKVKRVDVDVKRTSIVDESNFVPIYDETSDEEESNCRQIKRIDEKETKKRARTSSDSSEESIKKHKKKKLKNKKNKKQKRSKKHVSESSDSSDSEQERKKHKKSRKKKKSKH